VLAGVLGKTAGGCAEQFVSAGLLMDLDFTYRELVLVLVLLVETAPVEEPMAVDLHVHGDLVEDLDVVSLHVLFDGAVHIGEDRNNEVEEDNSDDNSGNSN